jgi:hypothetical protein
MEIKSVSNNVYFPKDYPQKNDGQKETPDIKIQDKLELSEEAKNIQNTSTPQQNRLNQISDRIKSQYYNSDQVISKVADKIYQEITNRK